MSLHKDMKALLLHQLIRRIEDDHEDDKNITVSNDSMVKRSEEKDSVKAKMRASLFKNLKIKLFKKVFKKASGSRTQWNGNFICEQFAR
jgi:hypothetical protein